MTISRRNENPECVDPVSHVTTREGEVGRCKGLQFSDVSASVISHGTMNNRVLITWSINGTSGNLSRVTYHVFRGESPENLVKLNAQGILAVGNGLLEFVDDTAHLLDMHKNYVYQIVAEERNTEGSITQRFKSWTFEVAGIEDSVSLFVISEHCFLYRHTSAGIPAMVFKKRHEGETCPECWDSVMQRVTKSNCITCSGTGKIGGYYDPIDAWIAIDPSAQIAQVEISGVQQFSQTRFSFTNYPLLRIGDIIVEMKTDQRWRITNVFFPQRNGVLFLQSGTLEQINRSDIEYKAISVPLDRKKDLISKLNDRIKRDSL